MNDIKNALAQLRAARSNEEPQVASTPTSAPELQTVPEPVSKRAPEALTRGEIKTLAGRVPLQLHRELTRALLDAADELRVSRINVDEALEAAMRLVLRDETARTEWYGQLREVRRERRES